MRVTCLALAVWLCPALASAEDFYVDPASGSPDGDGSAARPWRTLQEVVEADLIESRNWASLPYADGAALEPVNPGAPIGPGDRILLGSGHHGELVVESMHNAAPITIAPMDGATPTLRRALFRASSGWVLRGVSLSPSYAEPFERVTIVEVEDHGFRGPSFDVVIEDNEVFTVRDVSGWSADDWVARACSGISTDSRDVIVRGNTLTNVRFGISASGDRTLVSRNSIRNFSGDGLRGLGDDSTFEHNYVANCYDVDDNHDDGFQSWSVGEGGVGTGEVRGMTLRGNVIVNYEDADQPLRGPLQGIGCFDGFFVDWVVENNVIVTDHWHGITLLGARNARVVNNTVLDPNGERPGPPWIQIAPHKDGRESDGVVRNNLVTALANEGDGVVEDHNLLIEDPAALFVGPAAPWDLHLLPGSPAIDVGTEDGAPATDLDGIARPQGAGVDVGAYEWHEPGVEPEGDAGIRPPVDASTPPRDAGSGVDGGGAASEEGGGCGCRATGSRRAAPWALLALLGLLARRR